MVDRRVQRSAVLIWVVIIGTVWWAVTNHPAPASVAQVAQVQQQSATLAQPLPRCQLDQSAAVQLQGHFQEGCR